MSLKQKIHDQLEQFARHDQSRPQILKLTVDQGELEAELASIDSLGCAMNYLCYETPRLGQATVQQLEQIGRDLAERLKYLLEPIRPIEVDQERCQLQLRSQPPQHDDEGRSYYELLVERGGKITLCRYNKAPGKPRSVITANITREVFCRLASDIAASVR